MSAELPKSVLVCEVLDVGTVYNNEASVVVLCNGRALTMRCSGVACEKARQMMLAKWSVPVVVDGLRAFMWDELVAYFESSEAIVRDDGRVMVKYPSGRLFAWTYGASR